MCAPAIADDPYDSTCRVFMRATDMAPSIGCRACDACTVRRASRAPRVAFACGRPLSRTDYPGPDANGGVTAGLIPRAHPAHDEQVVRSPLRGNVHGIRALGRVSRQGIRRREPRTFRTDRSRNDEDSRVSGEGDPGRARRAGPAGRGGARRGRRRGRRPSGSAADGRRQGADPRRRARQGRRRQGRQGTRTRRPRRPRRCSA